MAKRRPKKRKEAEQSRREIWGVALAAVGVFLGACIYFGQAGLIGEAIRSVSYGLSGLFSYAFPPACLIGGIALIAVADQKPRKGRTALVFTGIWLVLALLHVIARPILGETSFLIYVRDAYVYGTEQLSGGGAVGALLSYPLLLLTGEAGAYIFLIAGILITILLVTSISLRATGQQVTTKVKAGIQQVAQARAVRRELYTATIDDEEAVPAPRSHKPTRPSRRPPKKEEDGLSFMPIEGPLQKKAQPSAGETDTTFIPPVAPTISPAPPVFTADLDTDDFPPFEPDDFASAPLRTPKRPMHEALPFSEPVQVKLKLDPEPKAEAPLPPHHTAQDVPYLPPSFSLLNPALASYGRSTESPAEKGKLLVDTLASFNVSARVVNISVGPVITRYELAPAPGVRVNRITALSDDIALALAAPRVRIEAPIPGKAAVGIEVPNKDTVTVVLRDAVDSKEFAASKSPITLALGKDIAGKVIVADLAKMPHLLIAGATGSGKSVCINDIIISLIYKCSPSDLQLILVDPKVVELSAFGVLPHLKVPVVTDPKKAAGALAGGVREMTERYKRFAKIGARDLERFNELQKDPKDKLPKLVIIIDELADLMMVAPDTVEDSICRIAQLGRAAGIHLIVATQRPSADVITGLIKANIPSRIAFAVSSAIDSRIILDSGGAEKLLGRGDMLFHPNGAGKAVRVQGAYVSDEEVERIVEHFKSQALTPEFDEQLIEEMDVEEGPGAQGNGKQEDDLLGEAVRIVLDSGQASISMIQRRLRVGYARAARLIDIMEQHGYVSGFDGAKPRKLLITRAQYEQIFGNQPDMSEDMDE